MPAPRKAAASNSSLAPAPQHDKPEPMTIRLSGTITARSPIFITRPEQGENFLTMNIVRNQAVVQAHVIPGETVKGLLRSNAYLLCVDAAKQDGELKVSLEQFYQQTLGGLSFTAESREVGADTGLREREPLLSLFGAATPKLTGRISVRHAIAQPVMGGNSGSGTGLPAGTRQDAVLGRPELADLLGAEDRALWSRQGAMVGDRSEAKQRVAETRRALGRARDVPPEDLQRLKDDYEKAKAEFDAIESAPEFQHAVQRPLPIRLAAPAGTVYDHAMEVVDASPAEVGLLLATLDLWNLSPRIGGGRTIGYGDLLAEYAIEVLGTAPLRRDRTWRPCGTVTVGGSGPAVQSEDAAVKEAIAAWREIEGNLRERTGIFG